jgi:hypothetical protein
MGTTCLAISAVVSLRGVFAVFVKRGQGDSIGGGLLGN